MVRGDSRDFFKCVIVVLSCLPIPTILVKISYVSYIRLQRLVDVIDYVDNKNLSTQNLCVDASYLLLLLLFIIINY